MSPQRTSLALAFLASLLITAPNPAAAQGFVVHEWGTFTSVAGEDGVALDWRPLLDPVDDLPDFVYTLDRYNERTDPQSGAPLDDSRGLRGDYSSYRRKDRIVGNVRMETPVLYFYTPKTLDVQLAVSFPQGTLTEWYPSVASLTPQRLDWGRFKVLPDRSIPLPDDGSPNHYYPARATEAATVRVCRPSSDEPNAPPRYEHERFLFYRGVGAFPQPLTAALDKDTLHLTPRPELGWSEGSIIVFDRLHGQTAFSRWNLTREPLHITRPALATEHRHVSSMTPSAQRALEAQLLELLTQTGLYPQEAQAMIATWRDHWFEEGLRVFYILPTQATEQLLPLEITPRPDTLVRTLVGRLDVVTPQQRDDLKYDLLRIHAASPADRDGLLRQLRLRHGRFLPVIARLVLPDLKKHRLHPTIIQALTPPGP